jgi:hypothetical protein
MLLRERSRLFGLVVSGDSIKISLIDESLKTRKKAKEILKNGKKQLT